MPVRSAVLCPREVAVDGRSRGGGCRSGRAAKAFGAQQDLAGTQGEQQTPAE